MGFFGGLRFTDPFFDESIKKSRFSFYKDSLEKTQSTSPALTALIETFLLPEYQELETYRQTR